MESDDYQDKLRNSNAGGSGGHLKAGSLDSKFFIYLCYDPEGIVDPMVGREPLSDEDLEIEKIDKIVTDCVKEIESKIEKDPGKFKGRCLKVGITTDIKTRIYGYDYKIYQKMKVEEATIFSQVLDDDFSLIQLR